MPTWGAGNKKTEQSGESLQNKIRKASGFVTGTSELRDEPTEQIPLIISEASGILVVATPGGLDLNQGTPRVL